MKDRTIPVYFSWGQRPANPVNQTNLCDVCVPTMGVVEFGNLIYDSERDARVTFNAFGQIIFNGGGATVWALLWQGFTCTNQRCKNKDPCGAAPTWVEVGSQQFVNPAGNIQWQMYFELAREIQCITEGDGEDCPPELPPITPPEPQPPPSPR